MIFSLFAGNRIALERGYDYCATMRSGNQPSKSYKIKESYRKQAYVAVISMDTWTNSWAWKGHIDFDAGLHSMFTSRTFTTAAQAEEHMRQSTHQCIDNRLG
jgi:hypothetical protein